jgi:hypothetical protein
VGSKNARTVGERPSLTAIEVGTCALRSDDTEVDWAELARSNRAAPSRSLDAGSYAVDKNLAERAPRPSRPGARELALLRRGRRRPDGPALGIELDEDAPAGKLGYGWRNRESSDDGSVVDW